MSTNFDRLVAAIKDAPHNSESACIARVQFPANSIAAWAHITNLGPNMLVGQDDVASMLRGVIELAVIYKVDIDEALKMALEGVVGGEND